MSEFTENGNTVGGDNPVRSMGARESESMPSNWEERLAKARAQREKVLEAKGKTPKKPKVMPPPFVQADVAADLEYKGVAAPTAPQEPFGLDEFDFVSRGDETRHTEELQAPTSALDADVDQELPLTGATPDEHPLSPRQTRLVKPVVVKSAAVEGPTKVEPVSHVAAAAATSGVSLSWVATVIVACFVGVGVGMVLSLGAVVALGWVSVSEFALSSPKKEEPSTVAKRSAQALDVVPRANDSSDVLEVLAAPRAHTAIAAAWQTDPAFGSNTEMRFVAVSGVHADQRDAPRLQLQTTGFDAVEPLGAPGLRIWAMPIENVSVAAQDLAPAVISVAFDRPARTDFSSSLVKSDAALNDTLPALLEKSNISILTALNGLEAPSAGRPLFALSKAKDVVQTVVYVPTLRATVPELTPRIPEAHHVKPSVFQAVASGFEPRLFTETALLSVPSHIAPPPAQALHMRAPTKQDLLTDLPQVDDASYLIERSIAADLGLFGVARDRFNLVTFAPTNLSSETIAENADILNTTGFSVDAVNRVNFKVSKTHVRYYRAEDAAVARAIAAEVGGAAKDFTTLRNRPPEGQVEVWLAGSRKFAATRTAQTRSNTSTAQRQAALKAQLENRLVNSLRRGEHLKGVSQ
ncbi:MAG: hypothetical protein AB8B62_14595 [Roseobacter sp.]